MPHLACTIAIMPRSSKRPDMAGSQNFRNFGCTDWRHTGVRRLCISTQHDTDIPSIRLPHDIVSSRATFFMLCKFSDPTRSTGQAMNTTHVEKMEVACISPVSRRTSRKPGLQQPGTTASAMCSVVMLVPCVLEGVTKSAAGIALGAEEAIQSTPHCAREAEIHCVRRDR